MKPQRNRRTLSARLGIAAAVLGLSGCATRPPGHAPHGISVMTDLPLFWGEGDVGAILREGGVRSPALRAMERIAPVRPVDELTPALLASTPILVLAQPRRLGASELAALERWVRRGGQLLAFADPLLVWPSRYALGDPRRAPPVTLLDPLLRRWQIDIAPVSTENVQEKRLAVGDEMIVLAGAGQWEFLSPRCKADGLLARCRIGHGRALFIADADLLDSRRWTATSGNERMIISLLEELRGNDERKSIKRHEQ